LKVFDGPTAAPVVAFPLTTDVITAPSSPGRPAAERENFTVRRDRAGVSANRRAETD
jgi:hypothetical protein